MPVKRLPSKPWSGWPWVSGMSAAVMPMRSVPCAAAGAAAPGRGRAGRPAAARNSRRLGLVMGVRLPKGVRGSRLRDAHRARASQGPCQRRGGGAPEGAGMAGGGGRGGGGGTPIVLGRVEGGGRGRHGGAWKVAYADFVTAMMAFFLLMWLLNATSEEQRRGIADFFSPANVLGERSSGSGLPFGGRTPSSDGGLASDAGAIQVDRGAAPVRLDIEEEEDEEAEPTTRQASRPGQGEGPVPGPGQPAARAERAAPPPADEDGPGGEAQAGRTGGRGGAAGGGGPPGGGRGAVPEAELRAELARRERAALEGAAEALRAAVRDDPALAELAHQLVVEVVPEGLRIQLLDAERSPMFALGSAAPNERARALLQRVAQVAAGLPNALAIAGHTDATPFRGAAGGGERSNWQLSADRANAVRRLLAEGGIAEGRVRGVAGHAEREPLLPGQPLAAANRRVTITLLREAPDAAAAPPPAPRPPARPRGVAPRDD